MEFHIGDKVYSKRDGLTGEVREIRSMSSGLAMIKVDFDGNYKTLPARALELVVKEEDMFAHFKAGKFDSFIRFRQLLTHVRISGNLTNIVYSMKYGDVDFLPHQFKPVFKFLTANTQRLLIADEVGLGKTIEALYIWRELQARSDARRLLVVVPSALTEKWFNDMSNHFGLNVDIADPNKIETCCKQALADSSRSFELVTSIQGLRNRKNLKASSPLLNLHKTFEEEKKRGRKLFDLVVIDEAHSLVNQSSSNHKLAETLHDLSENMILLSATPVNNKTDDLFSLLSLMAPRDFRSTNQFYPLFEDNKYAVRLANLFENHPSDIKKAVKEADGLLDDIVATRSFQQDKFFGRLRSSLENTLSSDELRREAYDKITSRFFYDSYVTRSRKKDVMETTIRSAQTAAFSMSKTEQDIYDDCTDWIEERIGAASSDVSNEDRLFPFVLMSRQREMDSCLPAAIARWKNMIAGYESDDDSENETLTDYLGDADEHAIKEDSKVKSIPAVCMKISDEDIRNLERNDSKYCEFVDAIRNQLSQQHETGIMPKLIVFSFFRATLDYLYRRLSADGFSVIMINGGMSRTEKMAAMREFKESPNVQIFLSSEVGAEGLDMQFANTEINYDLPWNPMRLEQRIGRIDRIGQKSKKIFIINLFCRNTISDRIRIALYDKIQIFTDSIGEIEDIMGDTVMKIEKDLLSPELTEKEKEAAANEAINRLCTNMRAKKELEESAGISKAYSDRILEYVGKAENSNRYIRREDLINYVVDFCNNEGNGSKLSQDKKDKDLWHFVFSAEDRAAFQNYAARNNLESGFSTLHDLTCTFPQGRRSAARTNIDVNHPLIKWMHDVVETSTFQKNFNHCYCMSMPRNELDEGKYPERIYVFCIAQMEYLGLKKKQKELFCYASGVNDIGVLGRDDSEFLIGQILFKGRNTTNFSALLPEDGLSAMSMAMDCCHEQINSAMETSYTEFIQDNEDLKASTLAKVSDYYDYEIRKIKDQIDQLKANNGKDSLIKGRQTVLANTEKEKEEELQRIENEAEPSLANSDVAVGVVFLE